jgi:hypothetical protein
MVKTSYSTFHPKSWRLGFVVGFALITPAAFAHEAPPAEARSVVADQLSAFERDDAADAFRLTAPQVRDKFSSPADFIDAIKTNYGPIYRHRSVDFGPAAREGDKIGMVVTIVAEDNEVWSALFVLSKQGDGQWRTSAYMLAKAPQSSV